VDVRGNEFARECIIFSLSVEIEEKDFSSEISVTAIFLPFNIRFVGRDESCWNRLVNGILLIH
jgi:hypothetical protein